MKPITAKALFRDLWPAAPAGVQITSVVTDSRAAAPGSVFVAIKGERVDGHDYAAEAFQNGAVFVVAEHPVKGVPVDKTVLVGDVLDAMIEMGASYRDGFSPLMLGVTGSVGKTSTKDFCAAIFSAFGETVKTQGNQNNEIGLPNTLFRLSDDTLYAVVEMGMQRLGEIRKLTLAARPDGAVISRIGEVHLATTGSVENILRAKMEVCAGLPEGAPLILNGDDPMLFHADIPSGVRPVYAGLDNPDCEVRAKDIKRDGLSTQFCIHDAQFGEHQVSIPTVGRHQISNALLAYTAATRLGLSASQSAMALTQYEASDLRGHIATIDGVTYIEDCYNAAPQSMRAGLDTLKELTAPGGRAIAVLGDMLELGEMEEKAHHTLGDNVAASGVKVLVTVGDLARLAGEQAATHGVEWHHGATTQEAAALLRQLTQRQDTVLIKASRGMRFEEILHRENA